MTKKTIGNVFVDYLMLATALVVSSVAAFYSISGLASIFPGALVPVIIMGSALEAAKVITTIWVHNNWMRIKMFLKIYLCSAIIILMTITSLGIFGFLSRAHVSQSLVSNAVQSKIDTLNVQVSSLQSDQKLNQDTLRQLDDAISQVVTHSTDDNSAVRALKLRNNQQKERQEINKHLREDQRQIDELKGDAAPLLLQLQKNEVDVGPIKYIAALIYGDNPSQNLLERAVRWMVILLVVVFDPMAIAMLLAFTSTEPENKTIVELSNDQPTVPNPPIQELPIQLPSKVEEPAEELDSLLSELQTEVAQLQQERDTTIESRNQIEQKLKEEIIQLQQDRDLLAIEYSKEKIRADAAEQKSQEALEPATVEDMVEQVVDTLMEQNKSIKE